LEVPGNGTVKLFILSLNPEPLLIDRFSLFKLPQTYVGLPQTVKGIIRCSISLVLILDLGRKVDCGLSQADSLHEVLLP
jgi:hypothetical protein